MPSTAISFDLDAGLGALVNLDYVNVGGAQSSAAPGDATGPSLARFRFADGNVAIGAIDFTGGTVTGAPAITLEWDNPDEAILINRAGYAALPALTVTAFTGFVLDIRGWQDLTIARTRPSDQFIVVDGVQTGTIGTARGDDVVVVGLDGADPADGLSFAVATGGGSDVVFITSSVEDYGGGQGWRLRDVTTTIDLGRGDDFFVGDRSMDQVAGGAGDDSLEGFGGADTLTGGRGQDTLAGGAGADLFVYADAGEGLDVIADFRPGIDTIAISAAGFGGGLVAGAALPAERLTANRAGVATEAFAQFVFDRDDGTLWWDADGTGAGAATLIADLGTHRFDATDLIVLP